MTEPFSSPPLAAAENARGSHEKWRHPDKTFSMIVPRSRSRHTANGIRKHAGLPKAF
jgi:predicted RNA binding protein YcfA (HicA-like mRNA interferase family)